MMLVVAAALVVDEVLDRLVSPERMSSKSLDLKFVQKFLAVDEYLT
jgi:hypothetical protein